jgi:transposase-like protein
MAAEHARSGAGHAREAMNRVDFSQNASTYERGAADKPAVMGVVERGGNVGFKSLDRVTGDRLSEFIAENADLSCRLITDDHTGYRKVGEAFAGGHETVKLSQWEYAKPGTDIHSNTIEGVFSLIKRGVMGTFHSTSRKHIPNYLNECEFRWNTRKLDDGERVAKASKQCLRSLGCSSRKHRSIGGSDGPNESRKSSD